MNPERWWELVKKSVLAWIDDYAPSMGAALAYYTVFSIAPLLIIVIAVAGLAFGQEAVRGEIASQLSGLIGPDGAKGVQGLVESASQPVQGIVASVISLVLLIIGATTVFGELQSALDRIWRVPVSAGENGIWNLLRTRLFSFGMVLGLGFLLVVSLIASTALAALGTWWASGFQGWEFVLTLVNGAVSFVLITVVFAMIYKIMPRAPIAWGDVWAGAVVTALLFQFGKFLIGLYIGKAALSSGFGAAGSLVVLLVWVYYSAQIFLLGAEFTWVYAQQRGSKIAQPEPATTTRVPSQSGDAVAFAGEQPIPDAGPLAQQQEILPVDERPPHGPSEFLRRNPIVGLGVAVTLGLIVGAVLRGAMPLDRALKKNSAPGHRR
ncbi:MAG: YihY/virulence factor BrkB family protein [Betaproteobacteria bacterium]